MQANAMSQDGVVIEGTKKLKKSRPKAGQSMVNLGLRSRRAALPERNLIREVRSSERLKGVIKPSKPLALMGDGMGASEERNKLS